MTAKDPSETFTRRRAVRSERPAPDMAVNSISRDSSRKTTIRDVAERAGVSVATVSAVVNHSRFVSPELSERVSEAIRELNYQPNRLARALKSRRSRTIAYLLPSIMNPFFPETLKGIEDVASAAGYIVVVCNTDLVAERLMRYAAMLVESRADGVIVSSPGGPSLNALAATMRENGIPIVVVHGPRSLTGLDRILANDEQGGYIATRHLLELGHRAIAFLGVKESTTSSLRLAGYRRALGEYGLAQSDESVHLGDGFTEEAGYLLAKLALSEGRRVTAVFAANDPMALGALRAAEEEGRSVPGDLSLVGFDDTLASLTRPKLTSVGVPKYVMGQMATQVLLERIEGKVHSPPREVVIVPGLVRRASTIPPDGAPNGIRLDFRAHAGL